MNRKRILLASTLSILLLLPTSVTHASWRDKVDPRLDEETLDGASVEFLVVMREQADLTEARRLDRKTERNAFVFERLSSIARDSQSGLLLELERLGAELRPFWIVNMIWVRGDRRALKAAAESSDVLRVDANPRGPGVRPEGAVAAAFRGGIEWNVSIIGADQIWGMGYDGSGVVIGSQDTGFFWEHPALKNQYRGWNGTTAVHDHNWHDAVHVDTLAPPTCLSNSPEPCDDGFIFPHGTYTMGVSVGDDGGSNRIGVSPGAKWIGCRSSDLGGGTPASYTECFQFLLAPTDLNGLNPDPSLAPHVVNNSWACIPAEGCNPDTLETIIANVRAAGIVVVAAAGNDGTECETIDYPPAIYDDSLTLGATDINDSIGPISSRGPVTIDGSNRLKPNLTAPGINVRSAVGIWDILGGGVTYDYLAADGTSAAAPHAAGAIALLLDARPDLIGNVDEIENLLEATALPLTSTQPCGGLGPSDTPNHVFGHGRLDLIQLFTGDADSDGTTNIDDCAPLDDQSWLLPGAVVDLTLDGGANTVLSWSTPTPAGGTTLVFDLLRSDDASDWSGATCLATDSNSTGASDTDSPPSIRYYLARAENGCGGSLSDDSSGTPRDAPDCS